MSKEETHQAQAPAPAPATKEADRPSSSVPPSGQGGKSPHDGTSYQDRWPANPEPSDTAKAWGEYLEAKEKAQAEGKDPPKEPAP